MRIVRSALLAGVLVLVGCGSSHGHSSVSRGECSSLTAEDVAAVIHSTPRSRALAGLPGERHVCGTLFSGPSGEIVVAIEERKGGAAAFARLRRTDVAQYGQLQRISSLGKNAYAVGKRIAGFRRGDTIVRLESGFRSSGTGPVLTVAQLMRLAGTVASRV